MAVPALKREARQEAGPVLRLVRGGRRQRGSGRPRAHRSTAAHVQHHRRIFNSLLVTLLLVMGLAMLRVQVTVSATEAALSANALKSEIESERIRAEMLEADRSALATPSRIESIAQVSMGMDVAEVVSYIEIPSSEPGSAVDVGPQASSGVPDESGESSAGERLADLLSDVMQMAAGEAQVLLVGDAGLATAR